VIKSFCCGGVGGDEREIPSHPISLLYFCCLSPEWVLEIQGGPALVAAREKSLLLHKLNHELPTLLPILKMILPLVQQRMSLSALLELPLFLLLLLGGRKDRLIPLQGRWCLRHFLGSALCPLLGVKPNTFKNGALSI